MATLPPAPYPDGVPEEWATTWLDQGARGEGSITRTSDGDFHFSSGRWLARHGDAVACRSDRGAERVWGALLADGRRVHCRRSMEPGRGGPSGVWRRRSDDGRSWQIGRVRFAADEILFDDGVPRLPGIELDDNPFERAMADQPAFLAALRDDSFAFSFMAELWLEALCTLDGRIGWAPTRGEAASTIVRLRGLWENWSDYKHGGPYPEPPPTDRSLIVAALAATGWRYQTDDEARRLNPEIMR
jgi:hypothetical protein